MVADKGKKLKLSEKPEDENADHIDEKLVLSIEKLQEVQDELEKRAGVRNAFVHALKNPHEIDPNVPSLGRFTRRFSSQMIALFGDIDISVAISAIGLVKQLLRHQHLPPEIRHVVRALEYEQLIAQESNSSQSGAGSSCQKH